ncbi:MAG: peptidoglycan-binding protein [Pseudolabrys sp.]|jgi:hypothetical protein
MPATAVALALGAAPALAQTSPGGADAAPYPVENAAPAHHPAEKAAAAKPVSAKPAAIKPAAVTPAIALPLPKPETLKAVATTAPAVTPAQPAKPDPLATPVTAAKQGDTLYGNAVDERLLLQAALLWAGDYTGAAENGDDPLATAVKNFQKRKNYKITGTLSETERAELLGAAKNYQDEFGWNVVVDPATGIRIGLPSKMVPIAREAPRGTLWTSRYGDVQVETFRYADPSLKLSTLFEREKQEPSTRRVEYSVLRDDSFFVSGIQGLRKFAVRAQLRNGEVRGFTMRYDQMMEGIVSPVMVAMASAFSPFPQRTAPFAALAKSVEYGNGLVVSDKGHIVTDARLTRGCVALVAPGFGDVERITDGSDNGLALLRIYGPRKLSPLSLTRAAAKTGDVTLAGVPDPKEGNGQAKIIDVKARIVDSNAIELRQPVPMAGFTGAAAIDNDGRFVGMMEMRNAVLASIAPSAPPVRLVRAEEIRAFLNAHKVAPPATATANPRDAVVRIICVRK